MDGSLEWNGIVDTSSITRLYTIYSTHLILPSIVKLAKNG